MVVRPLIPPVVLAIVLTAAAGVAVAAVMRAGWRTRRKAASVARICAIAALAFGMGMRPMVPNGKARADALNVDCLFVVDATLSMWAGDYGGGLVKETRMDGAREICSHMVDQLTGSSFAIVTFGSQGHVMAPFTQDIRTIEDAIDVLAPPSEHAASGTSLSAPHDRMRQMLESAAKHTDRKTIVVFVSDGESTDGQDVASYADLADLVDGGIVVGTGTAEGATMSTGSGWWGGGTVEDPETGQPAVSCLDEGSLRKVADELGVRYVHAERPGDVDDMLLRLRDEAHEVLSEREELTLYDDLYWVLAIPMAALMGWELHEVVVRRRV